MSISILANLVPVIPGANQPVARDVPTAQAEASANVATTPVAQTQAPVPLPAINGAIAQVNAVVKQYDNNLQFSIDQDTGIDVVKVVDTSTSEVIKQLPSPEILAIAKALDKLQGLLVKEKA